MSSLCSDCSFRPCVICGAVQWTGLESWITNLASCPRGAHRAVVPLRSHALGCAGTRSPGWLRGRDLLYNYIKDSKCMSETKCILKRPINVAKPLKGSQTKDLNFCNANEIFFFFLFFHIMRCSHRSGKWIAEETILLYFECQHHEQM